MMDEIDANLRRISVALERRRAGGRVAPVTDLRPRPSDSPEADLSPLEVGDRCVESDSASSFWRHVGQFFRWF